MARREHGLATSEKGEPISPTPPPLPQVLSRETLHKGKKFDFERLTVRQPSGRTMQREVVRHPGAVVIVPVLPSGRVVLIRVFRIALERMSIECCAGTIEPRGEDPAACAARELIEETGYRAGTLAPLGAFNTSPGLSDELMHPFVATSLTHVGQHLEEDEHIEVFDVAATEAFRMIEVGDIRDAKSMLALLLARARGHLTP
ncbi:MAG: NUDIX hydrolase [Phycisphaerales bacterium]